LKKYFSKGILISITLLLFVFLLAGCFPPVPNGDGDGNGENEAPVITSDPDLSVTVDDTYTYDVVATDADGDTLTYSLTTSPTDMTIDPDTGEITWTPSATGDYSVTVQVSDGDLTDTQSFTITVTKKPSSGPSNSAPKITSDPVTSVTVDDTYTYDVVATDADGDTLTYSLTTSPTDMTIDPDTGEITWTPDSTQIGDHNVTVEVSDGSKKDSQSFTVTVFDILESITVDPATMTLYETESKDITSVTASYKYDGSGQSIADDCSYSSDDIDIATVDASGTITGESANIRKGV